MHLQNLNQLNALDKRKHHGSRAYNRVSYMFQGQGVRDKTYNLCKKETVLLPYGTIVFRQFDLVVYDLSVYTLFEISALEKNQAE